MIWDRDRAQDALCQIDISILDGIAAINQRAYRSTGTHPLLLLLTVTTGSIAASAAIIISSQSEGPLAVAMFMFAFGFFLWPSTKAAIKLLRIVKRRWTKTAYESSMSYHLTVRPHWKRRIGFLLRCLAVFSAIFAINLRWPAPDFIVYLSLFTLILPLELYVRHSEPPVPVDNGLVSRDLQVNPT